MTESHRIIQISKLCVKRGFLLSISVFCQTLFWSVDMLHATKTDVTVKFDIHKRFQWSYVPLLKQTFLMLSTLLSFQAVGLFLRHEETRSHRCVPLQCSAFPEAAGGWGCHWRLHRRQRLSYPQTLQQAFHLPLQDGHRLVWQVSGLQEALLFYCDTYSCSIVWNSVLQRIN